MTRNPLARAPPSASSKPVLALTVLVLPFSIWTSATDGRRPTSSDRRRISAPESSQNGRRSSMSWSYSSMMTAPLAVAKAYQSSKPLGGSRP
jgi:hypothetical protein